MSAAEQRKLLEALMGKEALGGAPDNMKFTDNQVCRNYLCGLCPHDLFTNTKMDIGPCPKSHSPKLLDEYQQALQKGHPGFLDDWFRNLSDFVADCDRKVAAAQKRLDKTPEDAKAVELMRQIGDLTNEIQTLTESVEKLGEEGKVSESMDAMAKVEDLQKLKAEKEREMKVITGAEGGSQQQKLRVCEVCSAYLSIFDSDRRLADHFGGKMHLGFVKIREQVDSMRKEGFGDRAPPAFEHRGERGGYDHRGGYHGGPEHRGGYGGRGGYHGRDGRYDRGGYDRRFDHGGRGGYDNGRGGYDRRRSYGNRDDYRDRRPSKDERGPRDERGHDDRKGYDDRRGSGGYRERDRRRSQSPEGDRRGSGGRH